MASGSLTAGAAQLAMAALPVAGLETILGGRTPLVLAPHADDESLGCGGLLAACAAAAGRPGVVVLTDGAGSHPNSLSYPPERLLAVREGEAREAAAALGVERLDFLRLPDTRAPCAGEGFVAAVEAVGAALERWGCGVLLAPWRHDPHCDHLAAHLIAQVAAGRSGARHLAYPVWGWMLDPAVVLKGPAPSGWRLDIAAELQAKRRAVQAYRSQYAGLIDDDPAGFQLQPGFLARFDLPFETYLNP